MASKSFKEPRVTKMRYAQEGESYARVVKLFGQGNIVPQAPPFTDTLTMFNNVGISMVLVLKRYHNNNSE